MDNYKKYISSLLFVILVVAGLNSCKDLDEMTNPNEPTAETFWVSEESAVKGTNAVYAALQRLGTYRRWFYFVTDLSSDLGFSTSPWTDLSNVSKFKYTDYNFVVNYDIWQDHYRGIFRANQVLKNVPGIEMDETLKNRLLGEARFLRALYYYNLVNLYGNVPLAEELNEGENQLNGYPQKGIDAVWNLIEQDLIFAKGVLPNSYDDDNVGRATWGAATSLLAKAYMQQHKYNEALPLLKDVVESNIYSLVPDYKDNFRHTSENNEESIFEVQFSDEFVRGWDQDGSATSSLGCNRARFFSPVGWSDGEANAWYVEVFKTLNDPRLNVTYVYDNTTEQYYGMSYSDLPRTGGRISNWFNKYLRSYYKDVEGERDDDSPINVRVIRLADILLLYAEALNETGGDANLVQQLIQQVRDRVGAGASPFTQAAGFTVAEQIENERILELSGESQRWFDLRRYGYFSDPAKLDILKSRDSEFNTFNPATNGYLPIPTKEIDLNPDVVQNAGW